MSLTISQQVASELPSYAGGPDMVSIKGCDALSCLKDVVQLDRRSTLAQLPPNLAVIAKELESRKNAIFDLNLLASRIRAA
jgi:hypothetical protein